MSAYVTITRPLNGFMSMVAVWIGALVAGASMVPSGEILIGAASVFLISGGGMAVNDFFDAEIDKVNKPKRPIPSGRISRKAAFAYSLVLTLAGISIAYTISFDMFAVAAAAAALLYAYAAKLKKTILLGNIAISGLVALTFVYGGMILNNYEALLPLALLAFLSNMGREIYKTIDDAKGDDKFNVNSVAIKLGVMKARMLGSIFLVAAVLFSFFPYALGILGIVYLFFVLIADIAFLSAIAFPKHGSKLIKLAMLIALLAFIAGTVSF